MPSKIFNGMGRELRWKKVDRRSRLKDSPDHALGYQGRSAMFVNTDNSSIILRNLMLFQHYAWKEITYKDSYKLN